MTLKLLFHPEMGALYGAQGVGWEGADKRIDVLAMAIKGGLTACDLADLELAYAPPYSSAKDPVNMLGYVASNVAEGTLKTIQYHEIDAVVAKGGLLIDVREPREFAKGCIAGSVNIPLGDLRLRLGELPAQQPIYLLAVLVVSGVAIGPILVQSRVQSLSSRPPGSHAVVGQLLFLSSGQVNDNSSQGIADIVRLQLQLQHGPAAGKQYYAWLLPDQDNSEAPTLLLGTLTRQGQVGQLTYRDPQHTNLLASTSRLLVTEQDASVTPLSPSTDHHDWRYVASIAQIHPSGTASSPYSLLDHIRHLLAKEPTLEGHGLHGGLVIWLERNTRKLVEWSTSARDDWQMGNNTAISQMRQQLIRLLIARDGISYAPMELPTNTSYAGLVDPPIGNIGLLPFESQQDVFSLVTDVDFHLQGVAASPGVSIDQQQESAKILAVMDGINAWLKQVRDDDRRLLRMSDQQLQQRVALSLLNDLQMNAVSAFSGQIDQTTGARREGAQWVYQETQRLAEMEVTLA